MPDLSPPYHVESPAPGLNTGFCEAMTFFALANFCRFFTRGLRTLFDRRGVSPRFFRIARVSERGPPAPSSSTSTILHVHGQVRKLDLVVDDAPVCGLLGIVRQLFGFLLLTLLSPNE